MSEVCGTKYNALQLRQWLRHIGLPSTGTKSELLLRINKVPVETRGECPAMEVENQDEAIVECEGAVGYTSECGSREFANDREAQQQTSDGVQIQTSDGMQIQTSAGVKQQTSDGVQRKTSDGVQMSGGGQRKERDEIQTIDVDLQQTSDQGCHQKENDRGKNRGENEANLLNVLLQKELELVKREKELLRRENDFLKMITEHENRRQGEAEGSESGKRATENVSNKNSQSINKLSASFEILREMIPDYDGGILPDTWITQFKSVNEVYSVDEKTSKTLLMCKLKGKTQMWLHSRPNLIFETSERILSEMQRIFGTRENKLTLRRNFEARKWRRSEDFMAYYNEKVMLSNQIGIDEDELIEEIIDGIPDTQLKVQACLQCFSDKTQLLQAFSKIQLGQGQDRGRTLDNDAKDSKFRCYNCNSFGHFSSQCQKPKREMGACYGCGSLEHRVATCPKRKTEVHLVNADEVPHGHRQ